MEATLKNWDFEYTVQSYRDGDGNGLHGKVGEKWLTATRKVFFDGGGHLDLRYSPGWMTFSSWSVEAKQNQKLLAEATNWAREEKFIATRFVRLDMGKRDYSLLFKKRASVLISAYLRLGNEVSRHTVVTLVPREILPFAILRLDLLKELGPTRKYALPECSVKSILNQIKLLPLLLPVKEEFSNSNPHRKRSMNVFEMSNMCPTGDAMANGRVSRSMSLKGGWALCTRAQYQCIVQKAGP